MINARVINQDGNSVRHSIAFEAEHVIKITPESAMKAQASLGYHPQGYGFESFRVSYDPVLMRYKATWKCQASCD